MVVKDRNFSWGSALVGAAVATATALVISAKPRSPTSHLISVDLTSFKLKFPSLDAEMNLTVHVTNPNVASIRGYSDTTEMPTPYSSLHGLGSTPVLLAAGSLSPLSCRQQLRLPFRLSGIQLAHLAKKFVAEVGRRKMVLDSTLNVSGAAEVMWWNQKFNVHVNSHVIMDPVSLRENKSKFKIFVKS